MSGEAEALFQQALNLAAEERYHLARRLLDSLAEDEIPDDPEYRAELGRRLQSVADGTAELVSWEEARDTLRAELERRRAARQSENPS